MISNFAELSIKHIVIRFLSEIDGLQLYVYEDYLPPGDTGVTNQQMALVVSEISDATIANDCGSEARRALIQITAYNRCDDCTPGILNGIIEMISSMLRSGISGYNHSPISISEINRQSASYLEFQAENLRARQATFSLDYSIGV